MKASALTLKTIPVVVPFLGEELHLTASPAAFQDAATTAMMTELAPAAFAVREDAAARSARQAAYEQALAAGVSADEATRMARQAEQAARAAAEQYDLQDYTAGIMAVVQSWDYLDDTDEPLPITPEVVGRMWPQLRMAIWTKITEAMSPKSLMGQTAPTGSAPRAR